MPYRLVALDVDGTTVELGRRPSDRVLAALRKAQDQGTVIALATGRAYDSTREYAAMLDVKGPLICLQGAVVKQQEPGDCPALFSSSLPMEALGRVAAYAAERKLEFTIYTEHELYVENMYHSQEYYDLWFGIPVHRVPDLWAAAQELHARGVPLIKGLFAGEPDELTAMHPEVERVAGDEVEILRSHPMFLEVIARGVSKGNALAFLAGCYNVPQSQTIAIGDGGNDISMVRWAGLGVAVANAIPALLSEADWVAPSVSEDGVAVVLERFVLADGSTDLSQRHEGTKDTKYE